MSKDDGVLLQLLDLWVKKVQMNQMMTSI